MADKTGIEWCDATWNPTVGCSIVSPGCTHCYAMKAAAGLEQRFGSAKYAGLTRVVNGNAVWTGEVRLDEGALDQSLRWRRPRRIFVNSMSDLFHEALPDAAIDRVFAVMALAPQHTFLVLTKRARRMRAYLAGVPRILDRIETVMGDRGRIADWPFPNVWLGVSVEDQARADERIPLLLDTPAAVRFLSCEPLLGPVDLERIPSPVVTPEDEGFYHSALFRSDVHYRDGTPDALTGRKIVDAVDGPMMEKIDWVIAGGESGPGARPMHPDWARSMRDQCQTAGVPFFFKQWGEWKPISEMSEAEYDPLYRSNRLAAPHEDQGTLDEIHGRTCRVPTDAIGYDGVRGFDAFRMVDGHGGMQIFKVGKRAAGRQLDGREWSEFPTHG